jgi:hypothetical protein
VLLRMITSEGRPAVKIDSSMTALAWSFQPPRVPPTLRS